MDRKTYYQILGVLEDAEDIVIRAAYKVLAQKYHPDKWVGDLDFAAKTMQEIARAHEVLSDKNARNAYDQELKEQGRYKSDLGCGFGYTSAGLSEIFPETSVVGTNLPNLIQTKVARRVGNRFGFKIARSYKGFQADLVFASEYFEHFPRPVERLIDVIEKVQPTYWLVANSFGTEAIGHFKNYIHEDTTYDGRQISRLFNKTLRDYGYEKIKTKCWNNRPAYWKRN